MPGVLSGQADAAAGDVVAGLDEPVDPADEVPDVLDDVVEPDDVDVSEDVDVLDDVDAPDLVPDPDVELPVRASFR